MATRSADAVIKGYYYQFIKTIDAFFSLQRDTDSITIEGVEDVDITESAVTNYMQCKYLSSKVYAESAVRKPIILMLEHYIKNPSSHNYTLYCFFSDEPTERSISLTLDEIKSLLTYTEKKKLISYHIENSIKDITLQSFLSLFKIEIGEDIEELQKGIVEKIKKRFSCSDGVADNYYFNNALRIILDKAKNRNETERNLTLKEFINAVDCSEVLFNDWYYKFKSEEKYLKLIQKEVSQANLLSHGKDRLIFIGHDIVHSDKVFNFVAFIEYIVSKFYKIPTVFWTHKPFTVVFDIDTETFNRYKAQLIHKKIKFNDGYESINFSIDDFCEEPILNKNNAGKITKSSFHIRLVSWSTFKENLPALHNQYSVLYISKQNCQLPHKLYYQIVDVKYLINLLQIIKIL